MTAILRTSNYDTWGTFLRGQSSKHSFQVVNDGDEHLVVIFSQFTAPGSKKFTSKNIKKDVATMPFHPFRRCGIGAGESSDFCILVKEFIAQFVVGGKIVLTRHCDIERERGYVFGYVVDELTFGLRGSPIRFKPKPKVRHTFC